MARPQGRYFDKTPKQVRLQKEQKDFLRAMNRKYPGLFENESHVVRAAINFFKNAVKRGDWIARFETD